jgi:4-amino-4-deoxy-L-arabinose transferase-like glycosyltransferase
MLAGVIRASHVLHRELDECRVLGVALFGANLLLVGWIMLRRTRGAVVPALITVALCALSYDLLRIHATAWSECLFLLFALLALWFVAQASARDDRPWPALLAAAAFTAVAMMTRFAGVSVLMSGGLCLLILGRGPWAKRIARGVAYGAIAALPLALWLVRNKLVANTATNRRPAFQAMTGETWLEAARTLARWWFPFVSNPALSILLAALVMIGFVALASLLWKQHRRAESIPSTDVGPRDLQRAASAPLDEVFTVFITTYLAFLVCSISIMDHTTPLDWRILCPVFVCGLITQVSAVWGWLTKVGNERKQRALRGAYVATLAIVLVMYGAKSLPWVKASSRGEDKGYNSPAWRNSQLIRWARRLPKRAIIYTNGSASLRYHAGRGAYSFPRDREQAAGSTSRDKPDWRSRMNRGVMASAAIKRMATHLGPNGYIIFFKIPPENVRDERQLVRALKLGKPVRAGPDGRAYRMSPEFFAKKRKKPTTTSTTAPARATERSR